MLEMLQDWACKAEAAPTIMRGTMDPQRDREDGHHIPQDESGFLQRLSRRARNSQSRSHARDAETTRAAAAAVRARKQLEEGGHQFKVRRKNVRLLLRTFV